MLCKNCGAELQQKDNKFVCPNCGAEYSEQISATPQPVETASEYITPRSFSSKKNIIIIVIAAILILGLGAGITVLAVTNSPSFKVSQGIDLAERYLSEQNYEQAIIEYEKVLEIEPMNIDAYLGLAKAYEKMGDIDKAIEILREGLEMTGDERIEKRLDKLLNPEENSSDYSIPEENIPEELPPYGSMGSVTILGTEYDIATTTELDLSNQVLTNELIVPVGKLVNLKELNLFYSKGSGTYVFNNYKLNDISPLSTLTKLEVLDLGLNSINDLTPLAGLTNLKELNLRWNEVSDLTPLANLTKLEEIDVAYNQIKDISPLKNLDKLSVVYLQYNGISDITALTNHTNLTKLYMFFNKVVDVTPLENSTNLVVLDMGSNKINNIDPLKNLLKLTSLNVERNNIEDITALSNLTALENLRLGANNISNIKPLANLSNLKVLSTTCLWYTLPITDEDKKWLQAQLPNCDISF